MKGKVRHTKNGLAINTQNTLANCNLTQLPPYPRLKLCQHAIMSVFTRCSARSDCLKIKVALPSRRPLLPGAGKAAWSVGVR